MDRVAVGAGDRRLREKKMSRKNEVLGIHSIGEFVLAIPKLEQGEHFYRSFGLEVTEEGNQLGLRAPGTGNHRWGTLVEAQSKSLQHVTFYCFEEDLPRFKSHLQRQKIPLVDSPRGFDSDGLWFRGHDDVLMEIRVGPKLSPGEMSRIAPPAYEPGVANAPYRRLANKVRIDRLSHILLFTSSMDKAIDFYTRILGFRLSDRSSDVVGFLHAVHGSDHHMFAFAKSEQTGFHHASWIVPSIDDIGLGGMVMADNGYKKCWGTGRHVLGSNYFNYIQDPWGSWCEYACGMDYIPADTDWKAKDHPLEDGFYLWGPDLPPDFVVNYEA
jgi:catechol 2,3-dioxygenase-like lactoylglutathione lyase family enzyme